MDLCCPGLLVPFLNMVEEASPVRVGDYVECVPLAENEFAVEGLVVANRYNADGTQDYVVQIQPTLLGVFRADQIRQLIPAEEEPIELLVP